MKYLLPLITFLFFIVVPIYAEEKFEANYNINYSVFDNGITKVTQNITLKNKTEDFRPSEYSLELGLDDLKNLQASDGAGEITAKIEKEEGKTHIRLIFNQIVVGKDKILPFRVSFETAKLARKKGSIWEINIPGVGEKIEANEYNVTLSVPVSFGNPAFVKPLKNFKSGSLTWKKEEIPKGGMVVAFGQSQIYKFKLRYHLKNPRLYPIQTEIALPPQTNYQKIYLTSIDPKPGNIRIDKDGNWLATYILSPGSLSEINAQGSAQVFLTPFEKNQQLSEADFKAYLAAQKYWEVNDKAIEELANFLKTPENIYNFLVRELSYDYKRVEQKLERIGATGTLKNKNSAVCMEFTDLFIAVSRSAKIPAREINGFAYTENSDLRPLSLVRDILHAWPEYYDQQKGIWIMVDPTWGNTTGGLDYFNVLDFDHIAFVIKGYNSQYPIAAGGYKIEGKEDLKDVEISFGDSQDIISNNDINVDLQVKRKASPFLPIQGTLVVENKGNTLLNAHHITLLSDQLLPYTKQIQIPDIAPGGREALQVDFKNPSGLSLLQNKKAIIQITSPELTKEVEILISPLATFDNQLPYILGGTLGAGLVIFFTIKTWRLYFPRRQGSDSLRGQGKKPADSGSNILQK